MQCRNLEAKGTTGDSEIGDDGHTKQTKHWTSSSCACTEFMVCGRPINFRVSKLAEVRTCIAIAEQRGRLVIVLR